MSSVSQSSSDFLHGNHDSTTEKPVLPGAIEVARAKTPRAKTERKKPDYYATSVSEEVTSVIPRALLEAAGVPQFYPSNVELFRQGAAPNDIFLIESGLIKLSRVEKNGREVIVDLRFPKWLVGAASVILKQPYAVSAITVNDCYLRRISAPLFDYLIESDRLVSIYVHQMHSSEVLDKIISITQLGCLTARERLIQLLRRLVFVSAENETPREYKIQLPLKYWELAQLIAITPEHLSRLLKQMEQMGIVRQKKNLLFIKKVHKGLMQVLIWQSMIFATLN